MRILISSLVACFLVLLLMLFKNPESRGNAVAKTSLLVPPTDRVESSEGILKRPDLPPIEEIEKHHSENLRVDLSGRWVSKDGNSEMIVDGSDFTFNIVASYKFDNGHPTSFPVDTRSPCFTYGDRMYKFDYEGKDGEKLHKIFLLWRELDRKGFHSQLVLHKR